MATRNPELDRVRSSPNHQGWKRFGPYLSERQWGTVREDYSPQGDAWGYVTHDMARSYAYRWGEDGIGGLCDNKQTFCGALSLWNGQDAILKERLFGLGNPEGNHGEDVKELYYYLDATPTYSYAKMLYKYPQQAFPYEQLVRENQRRNRQEREFELTDTGLFDQNRYFDVFIEYAKASEFDVLIRISAHNRSSETAPIHLLPTYWFRNVWSWGFDDVHPQLSGATRAKRIDIRYEDKDDYCLYYEGDPEPLFCDNETNQQRLYGQPNLSPYPKDAINDYVVHQKTDVVNPEHTGTKVALHYQGDVAPGECYTVQLRLQKGRSRPWQDFDEVFAQRKQEADTFYHHLQGSGLNDDQRNVQRQAYAGMLWSKQHYHYDVNHWIKGDDRQSSSPQRLRGRNSEWKHLVNNNIVSMPDKWEYPWYAAWDLAFHCLPLARLDPAFAKRQLELMLREYYMHPNGQIPAYEWNFSDVNPPVHAWGAWRVYSIDKETNGKGDLDFLEKIFHKLLLNFTWWVNRKDASGNNLFQGGFLGLDNIGVFDRSHGLPGGGYLEQADATAWMAMYSLNMLRMALEISQTRPYYQEMASKFFNHFLSIAGAMFNIGQEDVDLWDPTDEFYYDAIHPEGQPGHILKVRSIVGIIPLFAVEILTPELLSQLSDFTRRSEWVINNRPDLSSLVSRWNASGKGETRLLSLVRVHRLKCILRRMLSEAEFLSDYGIRALSKYHQDHPYEYQAQGKTFSVSYVPGESTSSMFGGNSNWRGPIWFPINFLIIESLLKFHRYYGDTLTLEFPSGSGQSMPLDKIAYQLAQRLIRIFTRDEDGNRPYLSDADQLQQDPHFRDHIHFYEYFHGDNGRGLGASHQTGWTGLVSELIEMCRRIEETPS